MGVSGTGKSTIGKLLSEQLGYPYFDGDDYHPEVNVTKMASGTALNDDDRQGWLEKLNTLALKNLDTGAIIACSALKEKYRETLRKEIAEQTVFIHLTGSFELIKQRLDARKGHFMSAALLQSQFDTLEPPSYEIEVSIANEPQAICQEILAKLKTWKLP
nr:gluconokinase [Croceivirga radicis]